MDNSTIGICEDELNEATFCIMENPEQCDCIGVPESFGSTYPTEVDIAFQALLSESGDKDDVEFCADVERSICKFIQDTSSCCCQEETIAYSACIFSTNIASMPDEYPPCARSVSCSLKVVASDSDMEQQRDEQQTYMTYGIVASVILTCICFILYCCFSWRRRSRIIIKENRSKQGLEINVTCTSEESKTETIKGTLQQTETRRKSSTRQETKNVDDKRLKRKDSKSHLDDFSADESINWDDYNQTFHKRPTISHDIETGRRDDDSPKKKRSEKKVPKKMDSDIDLSSPEKSSRRTAELKERRRRIESWNELEKEKRKSNRSLRTSNSSSSLNDLEERQMITKKVRSNRSLRKSTSSSSLNDLEDRRQTTTKKVRSNRSLRNSISSSSLNDLEDRQKTSQKIRSNRSLRTSNSSSSLNDLEDRQKTIKKVRSNNLRHSNSSSSLNDLDNHRQTTRTKGRSKKDVRREVESSIRRARSVLKGVELAKRNPSEMKVVVVPALREVIELLEEEKWKLDSRQKSVEEEKLRLRHELEASKLYLKELHHRDQERTVELQRAKMNTAIIRSGSMMNLAETDTKVLKTDLVKLTEEREEMIQLLDSLRRAEIELGQQLDASTENVGLLQLQTQRVGSQLALSELCKTQEQKQIIQVQNHLTQCLHVKGHDINDNYDDDPRNDDHYQQDDDDNNKVVPEDCGSTESESEDEARYLSPGELSELYEAYLVQDDDEYTDDENEEFRVDEEAQYLEEEYLQYVHGPISQLKKREQQLVDVDYYP